MTDIAQELRRMGFRAREAARVLALASEDDKNAALRNSAQLLEERCESIVEANLEDIAYARTKGVADALIERLALDSGRVEDIANSLREVATLPDPVGQEIASWERPSGLRIRRMRTPLGVVGVIYESRPNVTADAGGLCLKSGNAVILRGGSEAIRSAVAIQACMAEGLERAAVPRDAIQIVTTRDRAAVGEMLAGCAGTIDVIVPRGGRSLVDRVQREAKVPVFAHLEGICHIYVEASADLEKAKAVVVNAKMRRTSICGAAECILFDQLSAESHLAPIVSALIGAGCEVRGDKAVQSVDPRVVPAQEGDWGREHLDAIISARVVKGIDEAIEHIRAYGSSHTEAIITESDEMTERFFGNLDSAILMRNASTQFADGGEFGLGAEIGIATGKLHARGPIGVEQLTTFKYLVEGDGAVRA